MLAGNLGLILLEPVIRNIATDEQTLVYKVCAISVASGLALIATFWYTNAVALPNAVEAGTLQVKTPKKKSKKKTRKRIYHGSGYWTSKNCGQDEISSNNYLKSYDTPKNITFYNIDLLKLVKIYNEICI